jgi:hemerythrin-like domain-containing protein
MANAVSIIEAEHRNLAQVLKTLEAIADRLQSDPSPADVDRLFDICHYVRVFPDTIHHPKEDRYIFGPLREAVPEHQELLDSVHEQHARCAEHTRRLAQAVKDYDAGRLDAPALQEVVRSYLAFQFEHMRLEEAHVLPMALKFLDPDRLDSAGRAFASHGDPLFGKNLETGFEALRERITAAE